MAVIIDMPKLSDTMTTGTLVSWLKNEGDTVAVGDMIAEVETDKATMELECFEDGTLLKQYVKAGETVAIGAPIAAVGEAGESAPEAQSSDSSKPAANAPKEEKAEPTAEPTPAPAPVVEVATPAATTGSNGRIKASPLARKMAEDLGVSLQTISGSGPQGRIVKADVLSAQSGSAPAATMAQATPAAAPVATLADETIPVSNMRRTIAQHLLTSKTTIPHFYLNIEVDAAPLVSLRAALNENLADLPPEQGGIKFTVNDFILKASAEALKRVPVVNSAWQGETIQQFGQIHLAFGVAIPDGLVTPVIRDAGNKSLRQISAEAKDLVAKARNKKLTPNEMAGSTFTVTNLGMFGITEFYGIINAPNAGILSVGATLEKPVVDKTGAIVSGKRMNIGFSGDHRVVDGVAGAEYLQALKSILETPALMLV